MNMNMNTPNFPKLDSDTQIWSLSFSGPYNKVNQVGLHRTNIFHWDHCSINFGVIRKLKNFTRHAIINIIYVNNKQTWT